MSQRSRANTNYQNGLIYSIRKRGESVIFYIGSTINLRHRRSNHKCACTLETHKHYNNDLYKYIRSIGGWECIIIEELYKFPCTIKHELDVEEGKVIKEYIGKGIKLLNKELAGRTNKEYKVEYNKINENQIKAYQSSYRESNRESLRDRAKVKITCDCGKEYSYSGKTQHLRSKFHKNWELRNK